MTDYPTEWVAYNHKVLGNRVYGHKAKCYEHALFDHGVQVGKVVQGYPSYTGHGDPYAQYGLTVMVRQFKQYREPAKRQPERKEMHNVRTEKYDAYGTLVDLTIENRMVYWNSKGPYIKTRGAGNVKLTDPDNFAIRYQVKPRVHNGETYYRMRLLEPGEETHYEYGPR